MAQEQKMSLVLLELFYFLAKQVYMGPTARLHDDIVTFPSPESVSLPSISHGMKPSHRSSFVVCMKKLQLKV